ncbi:MAG: cobalamin biosynthesis protein CbiG [Clostridiales bacterium]|uniref:cobalt-precorrin 5A hydrolase n=1 Tax=Provencibacterium massiliense TaxID=1841868 RepID=UPI0009A8C352|nr:cobalt-precorrin 5A hydrolase [Provencibacterium massiliense]PWM37170.1 MAG: cobalamin biosynthesis protein CbiG [Clostridiales bacterium]RGB70022.1 cobalamin biosynthesis protein CbiG [Harryflintia acetispora]
MKLRMLAFTGRGARLCRALATALAGTGYDCEAFAGGRAAREAGMPPLPGSLQDFAGQAFRECGGLIFVGACGIAVRAIAPHLRDKFTDPAVLVIDDRGRYVIPLLSGHVGGANELAKTVAGALGATPVITTATDVNDLFSVDAWAKREDLHLAGRQAAKEVSARLLDCKEVFLYSDFAIDGPLPGGVVLSDKGECGICLSLDENKNPFSCTLNLVPRLVTAGIGCRKGTSGRQIEEQVCAALAQSGISPHALCAAASIDCKREEPGLLDFCERYRLPLRTFTAAQLQKAPGEYTPSRFVEETVGVDNVCERAAVLAGGRLIVRKRARDGVTVALAVREWRACFE